MSETTDSDHMTNPELGRWLDVAARDLVDRYHELLDEAIKRLQSLPEWGHSVDRIMAIADHPRQCDGFGWIVAAVPESFEREHTGCTMSAERIAEICRRFPVVQLAIPITIEPAPEARPQ